VAVRRTIGSPPGSTRCSVGFRGRVMGGGVHEVPIEGQSFLQRHGISVVHQNALRSRQPVPNKTPVAQSRSESRSDRHSTPALPSTCKSSCYLDPLNSFIRAYLHIIEKTCTPCSPSSRPRRTDDDGSIHLVPRRSHCV
jgi:hypothetical protein